MAGAFSAYPAIADPQTPKPIAVSARATTDLWNDVAGGPDRGATVLNKLQVSATFNGEAANLAGFRAHIQIFRTAGKPLTERVGDVQTVTNIEAVNATRLFEAWVEQAVGKKDAGGISLRVGLIDLNSEFDSIDPASLFINSSHGIGPDLSKSGRNGPSIFPVSSLGFRAEWTPNKRVALRVAAFDGVPGDLASPKAFAAVRFRASDGALAIAQADYKPAKDVKIALGGWHYTGRFDAIGRAAATRRGDSGLYAFVQTPIPGSRKWNAWIRIGVADPSVQTISGYVGGGIAAKGLIGGRKDDRIGVAIARAEIGEPARDALGLPRAETTIETTYSAKFGDAVTLQPDLQYVIHPASRPGIRNALVFGLRLVVTGNYPKTASQEAADPNAPPDAPDAPSS